MLTQTYENMTLCINSSSASYLEEELGSLLEREREIMRGTAMRQRQKTRCRHWKVQAARATIVSVRGKDNRQIY